MLKGSDPIFAVADVPATIAYYRDVLGFDRPWYWGDPVTYGGIHLGSVHVMFNQQADLAGHVAGHQHYFWAEAVNDLHARHVERGADVVEPIGNRPWGNREYTVRDPNGYHLRFGGSPTYERPATARDTMPPYVRIEERLPTVEEYSELTRAVNWTKSAEERRGLDRSILGAVAVDARDGRAIGMARVVEDAYAWYSVWDVAVHPEHQGRRVGTAVLESVMDQLRQRGPEGAFVFLFTLKPQFYARLGFKEETCTMRRL